MAFYAECFHSHDGYGIKYFIGIGNSIIGNSIVIFKTIPSPIGRGTSIHPSVHFRIDTLQLLLGNPEAFPGQMRYVILPANFGSTLSPPASWTYRINLQREAPGRHPDQISEPAQLAPLDTKRQ